jgi:hypothetical protein
VRAYLRLAIAQNTCALCDHPVPRDQDIVNLVTDMMNATGWIFVQEPLDRGRVTKRVQQLNLGVRQIDEYDGDAVIRFILWLPDISPQRIAILGSGGVQIRDRDGNVIKTTDHDGILWFAQCAAVMSRDRPLRNGPC